MKYVLLFSLASLLSFTASAEGEKSSPNIDCCHTGVCRNDIPLCPGVTRKPERREINTSKKVKGNKGSKASGA
jgi:hypothetical protein